MKLPGPKGHLEALYKKEMFFTWPLGEKYRHSMIKLSEDGNIFIDEQSVEVIRDKTQVFDF